MSANETAAAMDIDIAAERARAALERAITEPSTARHRVDLSNALNYIETIRREIGA